MSKQTTSPQTAQAQATPQQVDQLNQQAYDLRYTHPKQMRALAQQALEAAQQADYRLGYGIALRHIGIAQAMLGQFQQAIANLRQSCAVLKELDEKAALVEAQASLGTVYQKMRQLDVALEWQMKTLPLAEELELTNTVANTLSNIAELYIELGKHNEALDYGERSIELREALEDQPGLAMGLVMIGRAYRAMGRHEKASDYFERALRYARELDDPASKAQALRNKGAALRKLDKSQQGLYLLEEAHTLYKEIGDPQAIADILLEIAKAYMATESYSLSEDYAQQAQQIAQDIDDSSLLAQANKVLSRTYEAQGDYKRALDFLKEYTTYEIEAARRWTQENLQALEARYSTEQQEKEQEIDHLRNVELANAQENLEAKAQEIDDKNQRLMDGLRYARQIQESVLPEQAQMNELLPQSFVLYEPLNQVSGDFYWVGHQEGVTVAAVMDCSGTGIPAALLTVVGSSLLHEIVYTKQIVEPSKILNNLHMGMRRALHQDSEASQGSQEALQIALLAYEPEAHELSFAGAQLSLYVLKRGTLEEIKGDSYPIGGEQEEAFRIFTNHRMALWGNEQLFLTTDGLARQAGGEEGKPYGQQGIKKLLGDLAGYEPEQQRQMIQEALQAWQNGYARTDDIAVLSFRP